MPASHSPLNAAGAGDALKKLGARLKMRHLILLEQIRLHGSLTRVAERMATSQPAVTHALGELEAMLGATLFERTARGMRPTAQGRVALERARAMLHDLDHLVRDIRAVADGQAAHLHIGVTPFFSGRVLAAAVDLAQADGRRTAVTVHEGTSDHLLPRLRDHALDLVIGRATAGGLEGITFEVLYRQPPRLVASRRLAARLARYALDWRQLTDLDWILGPPHTPIREQVGDIFLQAGLPAPAPIVESYSSRLIGELIAASERAVTILPADVADELVRIAGVAIVPFSFGWSLPPIALFTRAGGAPGQVGRRMADALRQAAQAAYPA